MWQIDNLIDRQIDRQTGRQTDRQTDQQTAPWFETAFRIFRRVFGSCGVPPGLIELEKSSDPKSQKKKTTVTWGKGVAMPRRR